MDTQNRLNTEIANALREAADRHQVNRPWIMAATVCVIAIFVSYLVLPEIRATREVDRWLLICALAVAAFTLAAWETVLLREYKIRTGERLMHSGVIERLALGWEHVCEIYDHVQLPWSLFLGPRPRSLHRSVRLLAYNLDWYLLEPRSMVRPQWVVYIITFTVMPLLALLIIWNPAGLVTTVFSGDFVPWLIIAEMALVIPVSWVANHYQARQHIAARLLHDEMVRRMRG